MRILIILMLFFMALKADSVNATINIIKNIDTMPNIQIVQNGKGNMLSKIHKMLISDLRTTGHFNVYSNDEINGDIINSPDLLSIMESNKIDLLAQITFFEQNSKPVIELVLYDFRSKSFQTKQYTEQNLDYYPFLSHSIAIDINKYIKADSISWMNGYVVFAKYVSSGKTQIILSDYTFTYQKVLFSDGLNIFPKWSNEQKKEFYYTNIDRVATIYKYDISTGKRQKIMQSQGMAIVSDVSIDESKLLLTLAPNELSDIYLYDISSRNLTRLTTYGGIDVSGHFVNNDSAFAFISDRLGYPNVFLKSFSPGSPVEQLVFQGKNNNSISSNNNYIVYSSRESNDEYSLNTFNIYLISTDNEYVRRLSKSGINRLPKFSNNNDTIMFIKETNKETSVGIIRLSINKSFLFPLKGIKIQSFDW